MGAGDWTSAWTVQPERGADARVLAKTHGTVFGLAVARAVFAAVGPSLAVEPEVADGSAVEPGSWCCG